MSTKPRSKGHILAVSPDSDRLFSVERSATEAPILEASLPIRFASDL